MAIHLSSGKEGRRVRPTMNVTPLVDVVLVLLIIFMVMTPLMTRVMSVHVPTNDDKGAEADPRAAEDQVILTVDAQGTIRINLDTVEDAHLPEKLRRVFAVRDDQTLFFDAAAEAPYGRAIEVLDLARGAGLTTIAVLTEPVIE